MTIASGYGIALGWLADQALGDPRRYHPVAGFGRAAFALEQRTYLDRRTAGVRHVGVLVGGTVALGLGARQLGRVHPMAELLLTAAATWTVLGGRTLDREAEAIDRLLGDDDLAGARVRIRNLVGRDPSRLTTDEIARACVESVAENTSDAVVAPLFWGAVAGIPGLLGYRAINTLDAMIGHRSARYLRFGWCAARLDDVVNWVPARISGALAALGAPLVGGHPVDAVGAVRRGAAAHPSPNAGVVEAAFAGSLGVQLGGTNVYDGVEEDRGTLGAGDQVCVADIERTRQLALAVGSAAALGAAIVAILRRPSSARSGRRR